jgi:hypothetical protein
MCFINSVPYDHIPKIDDFNSVVFYTDEHSKNVGKSIQCKCFCSLNLYFQKYDDGIYNYKLSDYSMHVSKYGKTINISIVPIPQEYDFFYPQISNWWCITNTEYSKNILWYWMSSLKIFWLIIITIIFLILFYYYNLPKYSGDSMKDLYERII